jgi:O-antigen/teichoic acid export membrane protein
MDKTQKIAVSTIISFIVLFLVIFLFTGFSGGYEEGGALAVPSIIIAYVVVWIWDKAHPKYACKVCPYTSAYQEEMRNHVKEHIIAKKRYKELDRSNQ